MSQNYNYTGQFDNDRGFEPSAKTKSPWSGIVKQVSTLSYANTYFEMPALFKRVSPHLKAYIFGFIVIFLLEGFATIGIVYNEGVPIRIIVFLIFIDIVLAYLPHSFDRTISLHRNNKFIRDFSQKIIKMQEAGHSEEDMNRESKAKSEYLENKIKNLLTKRLILYIPIFVTGFLKIYFFFQTYPFHVTYVAGIVVFSYMIGTILHAVCTGHLINYFVFFKPPFKNEWSNFIDNNNKFSAAIHVQNINTVLDIILAKSGNQKIIFENGEYKIKTLGLLFDEELVELINSQNTEAQKIAVAVAGKTMQL